MSDDLHVAVIAGTIRQKPESIKAAHYIAEYGRQLPHVHITFVDPAKFSFAHDGNDPEGRDVAYTAITAQADAFFVVTPEYNHSFPGSLKRVLDSEFENYIHKPVAFAGVSNGGWGGVRAVEALVTSVREMGLVATNYSMYFPRVQNIFDVSGSMKAEYNTAYQRYATHAYTELLWMARALKTARQKDGQ